LGKCAADWRHGTCAWAELWCIVWGVPEFPDIALYIERLTERFVGQKLEQVRLASPFVLRTALPKLSDAHGRTVRGFERIGKRIVFDMGDELFLVLHLMIAGRLRLREHGASIHKKLGLLAFDFPEASLMLTEASSKKRASLHVVAGRSALADLDPGGIDVFSSSMDAFSQALRAENHTVKRALTDPRILSGIGNSYSDEILHHARLSPLRQTQKLTAAEFAQLHKSCKYVLTLWLDKLRAELKPGEFPEHVTAFREGMAVHGRYGQPCPVCGEKVQRIAYADNETNYCARCQNQDRLLADRSLSRLLKDDWPKTLADLEERTGHAKQPNAAGSPNATTTAARKSPTPSATTAARKSPPTPTKSRKTAPAKTRA